MFELSAGICNAYYQTILLLNVQVVYKYWQSIHFFRKTKKKTRTDLVMAEFITISRLCHIF